MATVRTTILAEGTAVATSSSVTVDSGSSVKIGIFSSTANATLGSEAFILKEQTDGQSNPLCRLDKSQPSRIVDGPGVFEVVRGALSGSSYGVYKEV